jgi:hypothetical protein
VLQKKKKKKKKKKKNLQQPEEPQTTNDFLQAPVKSVLQDLHSQTEF